jgi:hypothetical protein
MSKSAYIDVDERAVVMELNPDMSERKVKSTIHRAAKLERKFRKQMEKEAKFSDAIDYGTYPKVMVKGLYEERDQKSFETIMKNERIHARYKLDWRDRGWISNPKVNPNITDTESVIGMGLVSIATLGLVPAYLCTRLHMYNTASRNYDAIKYLDKHKTYAPMSTTTKAPVAQKVRI